MIENLENRWLKLFGFVNNKTVATKAFKDLVNKYSQKHRFYHNLMHINAF